VSVGRCCPARNLFYRATRRVWFQPWGGPLNRLGRVVGECSYNRTDSPLWRNTRGLLRCGASRGVGGVGEVGGAPGAHRSAIRHRGARRNERSFCRRGIRPALPSVTSRETAELSKRRCHDTTWVGRFWVGRSWVGHPWVFGPWVDKTWSNDAWLNGAWLNGAWLNGAWLNGAWLNGAWSGRFWVSDP
jgi:hypothetical protein